MRRSFVISIVWLTACAVLTAAEFWEEKELTDWSDREVQRLMTNSPWAKRITVVFPRPPRETINDRAPTARLGGGGARGGRSSFGQFGAAPQSRLVVQWRSALPMRQAIVQRPDVYFIVVSGLSRAFARLDPRALRAEARLERRGKPPILPIQANPQPDGDGTALVYVFPQVEAITLEDEEVEFATEVAGASIERTFELDDMVVDGVLEL